MSSYEQKKTTNSQSMRIRRNLLFVLSLSAGIMALTSCSKKGSQEVSQTTGWAYNDPRNGDFQVAPARQQITGPGLAFIEGGTYTMGATEESPFYEWDNQPRKVTVNSFYMDKTEVRNIDYLEYIHWLQRVYGQDYPGVVQKALPDTNVWRDKLAYNEPLVETYFRHPAYHEYPVVGVSWVQANAYASWRTDRVNEMLLIKAGYLDYDPNQKDSSSFNTEAYLAGQYNGKIPENKKGLLHFGKKKGENDSVVRRVSFEKGILLPHYRLPTEAEWEFAALGLMGNTVQNRVVERKTYPWNGTSLRNDSKKYMGKFMANFKDDNGDFMGVAGDLNDGAAIPAPVMSYWPNDYGLYNMAGNVSEWVMDVYRPMSYQEVSDMNPFRGNVFKNIKRNPDGSIARKDSLGHIEFLPITAKEAAKRDNYSQANNINAKDGDFESTIQSDWNNPNKDELKNSTKQMYDYGVTTLINDKSRVIKGGSWADGPYYLSPGVRRYMDEDKASATVGFRCAMSRVGSPEDSKLKKK
ncbi:MAG: SUMF1/EgtB/PvdO family nonheme iron enzyme [Bacteroidales bacterium]|nr:SUMF1/EgtB/PvdO family nonheme iron enzyme [Bacteroidales bacterium]